MNERRLLKHDPFNLIITGVGGQGNVLASRIVGTMLSEAGYAITIGETFGASQRGGAVMSHVRIATSGDYSPQITKGQAHLVVSLEPTEAIRVLGGYGNSGVSVVTNTRPVYSAAVISGECQYPSENQIKQWIKALSNKAWFVDATEVAMNQMADPIFGNIILLGALAKTGELPLDRHGFEHALTLTMRQDKIKQNLKAFDLGMALI